MASSPPAGAKENSNTLARLYKDPALTLCYDKNLSVRSGIEKCPITDFPQMLARVPKSDARSYVNMVIFQLGRLST